jgi:hypothetical protein
VSNNPDKRKEKDLPPEGDAPLDHDSGTRSLRPKKESIPGPTLKDRIKKITGELDAKSAEQPQPDQAAPETEKAAPAKTSQEGPKRVPQPASKQPTAKQAPQPPAPEKPASEKPVPEAPSAGTQQSLTLRVSQMVKELPEAVMPDEVPTPPETQPDKPVQPAAERKKKTGELKPLPKSETQEKAAVEDIQPWQIMFQLMDATAKVVGTEVHRAMVVGRMDPTATNVQVDLDLAPYKGAEHGVSRQHAILLPSSEGLWIVDLDSTNGTWINGLYLQPGMKYRLRTSDRVEFGTLELLVRVIGEVPLTPPDRSSPSATSISRRKPPKHS